MLAKEKMPLTQGLLTWRKGINMFVNDRNTLHALELIWGCGLTFSEWFVIAQAPFLTVTCLCVFENLFAPYILFSSHSLEALAICTLIYGLSGAASDIIIQLIPKYAPQMHCVPNSVNSSSIWIFEIQSALTAIGWFMLVIDDKNLLYPAVFLIGFGKAMTANQTILYSLDSSIPILERTHLRTRYVSFGWIFNHIQYLNIIIWYPQRAFFSKM